MRDPKVAEPWIDRVTCRTRTQEAGSLPDLPASQPVTPPQSKANRDAAMPRDCKFIRSSAPSLARLRNISSTNAILLFTPVVVPASPTGIEWPTDQDPFEFLGRALSKHHRCIKHVPYVPSVGFTDTHGVFLSEADAVVVVTCKPVDGMDVSLSKQAGFAQSVIEHLDDTEEAPPDPLLVLLQFGDNAPRTGLAAYQNVLQADFYCPRTARQVAQLLCGAEK